MKHSPLERLQGVKGVYWPLEIAPTLDGVVKPVVMALCPDVAHYLVSKPMVYQSLEAHRLMCYGRRLSKATLWDVAMRDSVRWSSFDKYWVDECVSYD